MGERELFDKIKTHMIPDLVQSEKRFTKWDCWTDIYQLHIELKCRYKHYDDLLIEKSKWDYLSQLNTGVRYICSTPEGVYSFNIKEIPVPVWEMKRLPSTTERGKAHWYDKEVGYININQGINITHLIN